MPKKVQSTTEKILKKRARKKILRREYDARMSEEAAELGISVSQLTQQKVLEAEAIRQQSIKRHIVKGRSGEYIAPRVYRSQHSSFWD